jgi:hypothetical protein
MGGRIKWGIGLAAIAVVAVAGVTYGQVIRAGNLVITVDGGFSPTALPKNVDAPILIKGYGSIGTADGSYPPIIKDLTFEFDKHGSVETRGLPVCRAGQLTNTTVARARRTCPDAIVGTGFGKAVVIFPDAKPIPAQSPITFFNGPRQGSNPTIIAHAYTTIPAPTTFIVPITIQKIHDGRYGYRTQAEIPPIAGGYGIPTYGRIKIDRKWTYRGKRLSFINARCADGRLQARGDFRFNDGTNLSGTFFRPCTVRK